jgi:hypothetical protein
LYGQVTTRRQLFFALDHEGRLRAVSPELGLVMGPFVGRVLWAFPDAPFAGARAGCERAVREQREVAFFHEDRDGRLYRLRAKPLRSGLHVAVEPTSAREAADALADEIASVRAELLELRDRRDAAS